MEEAITGKIILKKGREKPVNNRHPWIFSGAIFKTEGDPQPGDLVIVNDFRGDFLATAYINPKSQISARLLSWSPKQSIDKSFWYERLKTAINTRSELGLEPNTTCYRLIFSEADQIPGLIVDKYENFLVLQCMTMGIDRRKEMIVDLLQDILQPQGIIERSDVAIRKKEGLKPIKQLLRGQESPPELIVQENGWRFHVNLFEGHKTGFYLDQRENRAMVGSAPFLANKNVLNVFAYSGAFSVYAAASGADTITNIDSSFAALELAEQNIALNDFQRPQDIYLAGDAFEILRYYRDEGQKFDCIILDPPKFAQKKGDVQRASRGYKDLNMLALQLLNPEGYLITFSCSGLISADLFQKILFSAAVDAGRDVQVLGQLSQAADHPTLLTFPESGYLKGFLCRVL